MNVELDQGKTLLVDGPASVKLLSGSMTVLGAPLLVETVLVVRQGKRLPLWTETASSLEVSVGEGACVNEVDENTIPSSWNVATNQLLALNKPAVVMVLGGVDSGKTSFCTFLVNAAVKQNLKTGIIDADLGQSDVGPPSTVGFNFVSEPVKDLFELHAKDAVFVGSTSPSGALNKLAHGLSSLKDRLLVAGADFIVVNTDGWISGTEAVEYKFELIERVNPTAIAGLQQENELAPIFQALPNQNFLVINSPKLVHPRNRENRRLLRELSYKKYMKAAKTRSFSFKWIKLEDSLLGSGGPLHRNRLAMLSNLLGTRLVYCAEGVDAVFVVLRRNQEVTESRINSASEYLGKPVKVIWEGDEEGLLVGLKDENGSFLGIGVLHSTDYKRKTLKVYTPVTQKPSSMIFGQIKLNKNFKEVGLNTVYSKLV
jgi:polynucleotide 5'-hydroxyl-kinase GRC3/NOL9